MHAVKGGWFFFGAACAWMMMMTPISFLLCFASVFPDSHSVRGWREIEGGVVSSLVWYRGTYDTCIFNLIFYKFTPSHSCVRVRTRLSLHHILSSRDRNYYFNHDHGVVRTPHLDRPRCMHLNGQSLFRFNPPPPPCIVVVLQSSARRLRLGRRPPRRRPTGRWCRPLPPPRRRRRRRSVLRCRPRPTDAGSTPRLRILVPPTSRGGGGWWGRRRLHRRRWCLVVVVVVVERFDHGGMGCGPRVIGPIRILDTPARRKEEEKEEGRRESRWWSRRWRAGGAGSSARCRRGSSEKLRVARGSFDESRRVRWCAIAAD